MKGKRIIIPDKYEVEIEPFEIDENSLKDSEVLLGTCYTLISPGTELAIYTALDPDVYRADSWCRYPFTPGYISVGKAIQVGENVQNIKEDETVFSYTNHASIAITSLEKSICLKIPKSLDEKAPCSRG